MAKSRKDSKGRVLRKGETVRTNKVLGQLKKQTEARKKQSMEALSEKMVLF